MKNSVVVLLIASCFVPSAAAFGDRAKNKKPIPTAIRASEGHRYIMVDQFGYRPSDPKVAVLVDPRVGYNASDNFSPGKIYQVRRATDNKVVFSAPPQAFKNGEIQTSSGDRGYWFDFSSVKETGAFYLHDTENNVRSHAFNISESVYRDVLKAAMRMFFYNRSGFRKAVPYADPRWTDGPAYVGPAQDGSARAVEHKKDPSTERDLRGGWFDAGDTNKYVSNATLTIHQLLAAYREAPAAWTDDFNIPESGNGVPDIIDEIGWEMSWLRRMQEPDGGVFVKLGTIDWAQTSPPGDDRRPRYYAPKCSSSTISAAGAFAHAATVFEKFPSLMKDAVEFKQRAIRAWNWYHANTKRNDCDTREVKSGNADRSIKIQEAESVVAAIYLYASSGEDAYRDYVAANYRRLRPFRDIGWSRYDAQEGEALLYFSTLPGVNIKVRDAIRDHKITDVTRKRSSNLYTTGLQLDLYRAYMPDQSYHWGSNRVRANYGNSNLDMITYGLAEEKSFAYKARALGLLHYLHGVNPQGMVYLSNMRDYGAEVSVSEIFHAWFEIGTPWHSSKKEHGPAPGYLVGGPNARYSGSLTPPANQPLQKSYRDWTGRSKEKAWEVTEPSINYQAAYVKLLSKFVVSK